MPDLDQVAPAQPDATNEALTAVDQTVVARDQAAFRAARQAERSGTPLAPAPVEDPADDDADGDAVPVAPTQPERKLSKRQEQINNYERTVAELKAENARLKATTPTAEAPAPRREPDAPATPGKITYPPELKSWEAYLEAHPDERYEDFTTARALHVIREDAKQSQVVHERTNRGRQFQDRLKANDPELDLRSLKPEVGSLRPLSTLADGETPTAMNAIAEEIFISEHPERFLRHFNEHIEELTALGQLPSRDAIIRAMGRLDARLEPAQREAAPLPAPKLTNAPAPLTTLGARPTDATDPIEVAIASKDQTAFKAARLRERMAQHR